MLLLRTGYWQVGYIKWPLEKNTGHVKLWLSWKVNISQGFVSMTWKFIIFQSKKYQYEWWKSTSENFWSYKFVIFPLNLEFFNLFVNIKGKH